MTRRKFAITVLLVILLTLLAQGIVWYEEKRNEGKPEMPKEFIGSVSGSTFKGNGNGLTIYFKSSDGTDYGTQTSCPAGWTEVLDGYGPHYVGLLAYDWFDDGTGGTGGGFLPGGGVPPGGPGLPPNSPIPGDPPPPDDPDPPNPGDGDVPPPDSREPTDPDPPEDPEPAITPGPDADETVDELNDRLNKEGQEQTGTTGSLWGQLINTSYAVNVSYYLTDIGFGSDDLCTLSSLVVVPMMQISQNQTATRESHRYSDACSVHPTTGTITCNRCKICRK